MNPRIRKYFATLALLLPLGLTLSLHPGAAHAISPGIDYNVLSPAQRTEVRPGQIEVLEFFWYRCPHCDKLQPDLKAWERRLPANVVVRRVPAVLNDNWLPLTRAYYALEAVGALDRLHQEVFHAIHRQGMDFNNPETFFNWAAGKGVDRRQLATAYGSFAVNGKVMRARQLTQAYRLDGVPAFAVNGKFTTSAAMTGSYAKLFEALDALIAMEQRGIRPR